MSNDDTGRDCLPPPVVLIAAADDSFRSFLEYAVQSKGLVVAGVKDGKALTNRLQELTPEVLIFESRLAGIELPKLCARLRLDRRTRSIWIIAIAAEGDDASQKEILDSGADQYFSRPFSPETLLNSIGAIRLNSNPGPALERRELLTFRDLELNVARYRVRRNGRMIHLAPTEFRLLHHLIKNPHRVYSRDELQKAAWPRAVHIGPRTVDVHIGRLRVALNEAGGQNLIRTVRSIGYSLSE